MTGLVSDSMQRPSMMMILVISAGCSFPSEPHGAMDVRVPSALPAYVFRSASDTSIQASAMASVTNGSSASITVNECDYHVEQETSRGWEAIWSPLCLLPMDVVVAAGETRQFRLSLWGTYRGTSGPTWPPRTLEGRYRFVLRPAGSRSAPSNPFVLTEQPQG